MLSHLEHAVSVIQQQNDELTRDTLSSMSQTERYDWKQMVMESND